MRRCRGACNALPRAARAAARRAPNRIPDGGTDAQGPEIDTGKLRETIEDEIERQGGGTLLRMITLPTALIAAIAAVTRNVPASRPACVTPQVGGFFSRAPCSRPIASFALSIIPLMLCTS